MVYVIIKSGALNCQEVTMRSILKKSIVLFVAVLPFLSFNNVIAHGGGGGGRGGGFEAGGRAGGFGQGARVDQGDHRVNNPEAIRDDAAARRDWNQGFDAGAANGGGFGDTDVYVAPPNEGAPPETPINPYPYPQ
jgi:hypothetical protein